MNSFDFKSFTSSSNNQKLYAQSSIPKNGTANSTTVGGTTTSNTLVNDSQITKTEPFIKGQIIKAEVIDLRGKEIKIQLNNSEIISAKINLDVPLSIGDHVSFQVEDASPSSISLKVMTDNRLASQSIIIDKALEDANIPKTDRSLQIVKELLENQMSIDKGNIQKLLQQALMFKNASVKTLVLMNKYGIELNDINTTQFEAYQNYEHRLMNGSIELIDSILEGINSSASELSTELNHLLLKFATRTTLNETSIPSKQNFSTSTHSQPILNSLNSINLQQLKLPLDIQDTINALELSNPVITNLSSSGIESQNLVSLSNITKSVSMDSDITTGESTSSIYMDTSKQDLINTKVGSTTTTNNLQLMDTTIGDLLNAEARTSLLHTLQPMNVQNEMQNAIMTGSCSFEQFINTIQLHATTLDAPLLHKLQVNSAYQTLLKEAIINQWTLKPSMLKDQQKVDNYYQQLEDDLNEFSKLFHRSANESSNHSFEDASKNTKNLQDNINFMKTLNQLFTYVQLPMKLSTQNAHSELFVYSKKKSKLSAEDSISVLLHLDMAHLGPLDIHLDLKHSKLTSKIYTNDNDSKLLLSTNIYVLEKALELKGYSSSFEIIKQNKSEDSIKDKPQAMDSDFNMKRYTFDIRA